MTAFLCGVAAGLYLALTIWWIEGMYRDRKPRREVRSVRGRSASPSCGAAGPAEAATFARHTGDGGPTR